MPTLSEFRQRWGNGPLSIYVIGILLPVLTALLRPALMPLLGLPIYATLFWVGPFASAAVVFWSGWSPGWRAAWVLLIPVFVAATFLPMVT
jgi:hypothetical protein